MLEPQSDLLFALLILGFAGLMFGLVKSRRAVLKIGAAVLAFVLAMQVGILAVNRYFDYYPTWGSAVADLTNHGAAIKQISDSTLVNSSYGKSVVPTPVDQQLAARQGFTFQVELAGPRSHISRRGLIYLPPQYFQPEYRHYQFPVIELIHGQPGVPQDWINVAGVTAVLDELVNGHLAKPAVLVMPDANGGQRVSLQCLNVRHGPADMTYLGQDVPADVEAMLAGRVQPVGPSWGIAGYSEGGYCAANLALHLRRSYGFAGVLSGYFFAESNDLLAGGREVDPFASRHGFFANSPAAEVRSLHPGAVIPQFWVGAGAADRADVQAADYFVQLLALYQVVPPVQVAPGGHTMGVWRAELPAMLEWMTAKLAQAAVILHEQAVAIAKHESLPCRIPARAKVLIVRAQSPAKRGPHQVARDGPPFASCGRHAPRGTGKHHVSRGARV
jgi:enterochelin esterase-like enzyme